MFGLFKAARERHQQASTAQQELIVAFDAMGVNFMRLHPVIHGAIRREAMVVGTEEAVKYYVKLATDIEQYEDADDDQKANVFLEIYRARGKRFAEALG